MKKYIIGIVLGLTIVVSPVYAQSITTQTAYESALMQLITLLQAQVADLMAQLQVVQAQQVVIENKVDVVVKASTPAPVVVPVVTPTSVINPVPTFGSITNNVPQIMKEIIVKNETNVVVDAITVPANTLTVFFNIDYRENGRSVLESVTTTTDEGVTRVFNKNERACGFSSMGGTRDDCSVNHLYRVTTPGPHSVTFTVGETSKTININVQ